VWGPRRGPGDFFKGPGFPGGCFIVFKKAGAKFFKFFEVWKKFFKNFAPAFLKTIKQPLGKSLPKGCW